MVEFTDRSEELAFLKSRFEKLEKGELVILFGRRRVGKTELVAKFLSGLPQEQKAYLLIDEGTPADMLKSISEDVALCWPEARREFSGWESFFSFIADRAAERKIVVAIDEFQRLHADPRALTRFQKAWDTQLKNLPVMVILLGSAVGAIQKIAIGAKSPLFGRATGHFQLRPFTYQAFRQALSGCRDEALLVRLYSILGGMPAYLEFAERCCKTDYMAGLEEEMLRTAGRFRDEPQTLLRMELKDTGRYNSILATIAAGHRNPKEISDQTGIAPGPLVFYLGKLERYLGIIRKISPLCGKHRPQYALQDNLFAFWYKFIFRNLSTLEIGNYDYVKKCIRDELPAVEGRVFEDIMRQLLSAYNGRTISGVPISFTEIGGWWGRKGEELDILATSKNSLILGEVKWTEREAGVDVAAGLEKKLALISCSEAQRTNVRFIIASKNGFTPQAVKYMQERGMLALTLKDVTELYDSLPQL